MDTKKKKVQQMYEQGVAPLAIAQKLNMHDTNVYKIIREYKTEQELKVLRAK